MVENINSSLEMAQQYLGKTQEITDIFYEKNLHMLCDALGLERDKIANHIPIPMHWIYHGESVTPENIGRDGHPHVGLFMPSLPAKRRMFIGSEITLHDDTLPLGVENKRIREILSIDKKEGASGVFYLVKVKGTFETQNKVFLEEIQTIAYLDSWGAGRVKQATDTIADTDAKPSDFSAMLTPNNVMLFRFSALTNNNHRIHYDKDYAVGVEKYPNIVIHGPLSATMLGYYAHLWLGKPIKYFKFRTKAPLFLGEEMRFFGKIIAENKIEIWVSAADGQICVTAQATC